MKVVVMFGAIVIAAASSIVACSEDQEGKSGPASTNDGGDASSTDGGSLGDVGAPVVNAALTPVDEADTPCAVAAAPPKLLYASQSLPGIFHRVGTVGGRRWADDVDGNGTVLFDADGANPAATPLRLGADLSRVAAGPGDDLVLVGAGRSALSVRRHDANGTPVGDTALFYEPDRASDVFGARGPGTTLLVWPTPGAVRGALLDATGTFGDPIDFETATEKEQFTASIASDGSGSFGVAWSVLRRTDGRTRSYFASVDAGKRSEIVRLLLVTDAAHKVVQLVRTDTGYVVLLQIDQGVVVGALDRLGRPYAGGAKKLLGAVEALGVASRGTEVCVVASRADGTYALRPLTSLVAPLGGWACFGNASSGAEHGAAIDAQGAGYVVVATESDRSTTLRVVGRLGTGP